MRDGSATRPTCGCSSTSSRALGIKPYSTRTEAAFLENLNHALDNTYARRYHYIKEILIRYFNGT